MGFPERLQSIIEEQRISKYKIAKAIDISASTVSNYIKGKTKPDSTTLTVLCKLLGVNKAWLQTGDGPKYITEEPQTVYNRTPADIDDKQMIRKLINLLESQHESIREKDMQITLLIRKIPDIPSQN